MTIDEKFTKRYQFVAGVDEVGCCNLAGPIVASAIIIKLEDIPNGVTDSKKLTEKNRRKFAVKLRENAVAYSVAKVTAKTINKIGFGAAHKLVMERAVRKLKIKPDFVLFDYHIPKARIKIKKKFFVNGDSRSKLIAAASIIAKCAREDYMRKLARKYPYYGFEHHFGNYNAKHVVALKCLGILNIHRHDFIENLFNGKLNYIEFKSGIINILTCKKNDCDKLRCAYWRHSTKLIGVKNIVGVKCRLHSLSLQSSRKL